MSGDFLEGEDVILATDFGEGLHDLGFGDFGSAEHLKVEASDADGFGGSGSRGVGWALGGYALRPEGEAVGEAHPDFGSGGLGEG